MTTAAARKPWTEKETEYLLRHAGKKTYADIGSKLKRSEQAVGAKARSLGAHGTLRNWTKEEDDFVLDLAGDATIQHIAQRLRRSPEAVTTRMEKLGVYDLPAHGGAYRTYEFADILGVDPSTVLAWIKDKGLPARQLYKRRGEENKSRYWYLFSHDFWTWAKANKERIHFAKIERGILLPEPSWLSEAIATESKPARHQAEWTTGEDKQLAEGVRAGNTQLRIGESLGRSRRSVQKRIAYLKSIGRWSL